MAPSPCMLFVPPVRSLVALAPVLLAGLVSVLLSSSLASAVTGCPPLYCSQPDQCSDTIDGILDANGPGWIGTSYEMPSGDPLTGPGDCCALCLIFKASCRYWTFGIEKSEPVCHIFTPAICDSAEGNHYTPCEVLDKSFSGTNYTTGSVCPSVLSPPPPVPAPGTPSPPPPAGVVGDPHYTGADQSHFDFTGLPGKTYCMLSDTHLHVNVFHGGRFDRWGANPHKPLTWIRQLAVLWDQHIIHLAAREGAEWRYVNGYMGSMTVDNEPIQLSKPGDSAFFFDGKVRISWVAGKQRSGDDEIDVYEVKISDVLHMTLKLRPEIELLRTTEDGVVHFGLELPELTVSQQVHGVLGQTFRTDHQNRLALQKLEYSDLLKVKIVPGDNAEGFIDGRMEDYETSSLFHSDCSFSRFTGNQEVDHETATAVEMGSGAQVGSSYSGGNAPRKMMKLAASSK